jgi:hypothetical protein
LVASCGHLSELNNYTTYFSIDLSYRLDLLALFLRICLIDIDSIYLYDPIYEAISKIQ